MFLGFFIINLHKMKNIISIISWIIFIVIFSFFYAEEYFWFHQENKEITENIEYLEEQKNNFSLEKIKNIKNIEIFQMPNKKLLEQIVQEIDTAENKIYLESYILTETRIQEAIKRAKKRWLDVKILLEKNPYKAYNINNKAQKNLEKSWINVQWSDSDDFSLNHSKFIIIDDFAYISTGNFSYSTFTTNRDYYIKIINQEIITKLNQVFTADYAWEKQNFYHPNLVLSPYNSRDTFEKIITWANESLDIYAQYFSDEKIENLLIQTAKKWVKIRVIMRKNSDENDPIIETMKQAGIEIYVLSSPAMHSKMFLVDNTYLFLWSVNLSSYSLDKNRELGILLKNTDLIKKMSEYFQKDILKIIGKK